MRSRGFIFTILLLSISLTLLYLYSSSQKVKVDSSGNVSLAIKSIPEQVQIVLYGDVSTSPLASEKLFDDFTPYHDFLHYWQETSANGYFLYALRVEFDKLDGAFILPYTLDNALLVQNYIRDSYPYTNNENLHSGNNQLFADGKGHFMTYLESEDVICFGQDYSLVELLEQACLDENSDLAFQKELLTQINTPDITSSTQKFFYRPNIVPLGRRGVGSLEDFTMAKWVKGVVTKDEANLTFYSIMPSRERANSRSVLPVALNLELPTTAKMLTYWDNDVLLDYLGLPIDVKSTQLENLWNSKLSDWLSDVVEQGAFVYYLDDPIMVSEKLIRIPLSNTNKTSDSLHQLLEENRMIYKNLLREETIQGYWKIDVMPAIFGVQQLAEVTRDRRLLYYKFTNQELLLSFNYNILFNYLADLESTARRCLESVMKQSNLYTFTAPSAYFWASLPEIATDSTNNYPSVPYLLLQESHLPYLYLEGVVEQADSTTKLMYKFTNKLAIEHN